MAESRRSRSSWREVVARYEARRGEVTMRKFAEEEGLKFGTFRWWVREFRRAEQEQKTIGKSPDIVPVDISGACGVDGNDSTPLRIGNWLEAETAGGIKVRFCEGTRTEYVGALVLRLAGPSLPT